MIQRRWSVLVSEQLRAFLRDKPCQSPSFPSTWAIMGKDRTGIKHGIGSKRACESLSPKSAEIVLLGEEKEC